MANDPLVIKRKHIVAEALPAAAGEGGVGVGERQAGVVLGDEDAAGGEEMAVGDCRPAR